MSGNHHFIRVCACGNVLGQCRCASASKERIIVSPCRCKAEGLLPVPPLMGDKAAGELRDALNGLPQPQRDALGAAWRRHYGTDHLNRMTPEQGREAMEVVAELRP